MSRDGNGTHESGSVLSKYNESAFSKVMLLLYSAMSVWIIVVNTMTLVVYGKSRTLMNRRNVLIVSLSTVDLFTGLTTFMPKLISNAVSGSDPFTICMISSAVQIAPPWSSIFHLVAIAIERHIAITKPLMYQVLVTPRRLAFAVCANIGSGCFFALVPLAWPRDQFQKVCLSILWYPRWYRYTFLVVPMAVALSLISLIYLHIYTIARTHERAISAAEQNNPNRNDLQSRKESRATRVFILICGIALACYVPFWTAIVLLISKPNSQTIIYIYYLSSLCLYSNSGMNFVVYAVRNEEFRTKMNKLFKRNNSVLNDSSATD
ncbi:hypothetical protein LSH36_460g01005 [Paralvinella palmiformis]|uniref:G-protein coupled receptors family 1 profile domain-containing protein n=1 Tax=Paralvinella palmiformis TaxID=53620 RepID=A0AAD9MXM9_9ANNE|nr:hypothetical protein LSH36_460g01005 [Paralvinella palmiformis]